MRSRLLAAVLRGLKSRAALSGGCLVLTAVAVASAVLGPAYQSSATRSFLVTRLQQLSVVSAGVTITLSPSKALAGDVDSAQHRAAAAGGDVLDGAFGPASTSLVSGDAPVEAVFGLPYQGAVSLRATDGACTHLTVTGTCPSAPGQALISSADADGSKTGIGDVLGWPDLDGGVTVVGTYTVPEEAEPFFFDLSRYAVTPPTTTPTGTTYTPGPLLVDVSTFAALPAGSWRVQADRRLNVLASTTDTDVEAAVRATRALPPVLRGLPGGSFETSEQRSLPFLLADIDRNRKTASKTVTPAVVSLVLVALALLIRLLGAAADNRRPELALASLRGMSRRQMWAFGLAEPFTILAVATPVGMGLGLAAAEMLARTWLTPGLRVSLPLGSWLAATLVLAAAAVATSVTVGRALAEPLSSQLVGVRRPSPMSRAALVSQLVVVVTALALVATRVTTKGRSDPDTTDLVLPLALALAGGLVVGRLAVSAAQLLASHSVGRRGIAGFVAVRAVSRRREGALVILPLTAAMAISVFAAGMYSAASNWRASAAATRVGADAAYVSAAPMSLTVALTHEIDPDGRWLMAAGVLIYSDVGEKVIVDAPRLGRVAAWPDQWTPGLSADEVGRELAPRRPPLVITGTKLSLTLDNAVTGSVHSLGVGLAVETRGGRSRSIFFGPFASGESADSLRAPFCADGCVVKTMTFGGPAATAAELGGVATISSLTADGAAVSGMLEDDAWEPIERLDVDLPVNAIPQVVGGRLEVTLSAPDAFQLVAISPSDVPSVRPVLMGRSEDMQRLGRRGDDLLLETGSGDGLAVHPFARSDSLPFVGPRGMMIDYTMLTRNQSISDAQTQVYVLARGDTPQEVLDALAERGVNKRTSLAETKKVLDQDAYALSLNLYLVAALAAIGLAVTGLVANMMVQMPARRRDSAALRVVGVRRHQVMRAVFLEICVVLGLASLAGIAAGALAQSLVVRSVTLGTVDDLRTPRVVGTLDATGVGLLVGLVIVVLVVVATAVAGLAVSRARASTLRESTR
ncbi:MAG: FtsX-like permease family protein [Propionibacteriales bacterium]|nr:FtsX-like permease family protein [Propionibacteriales bacterium]